MLAGIAAASEFIELDASWPLMRSALADRGHAAEVAAWDDPTVDWSRFDLVAAMYTWGYVLYRDVFLDWAQRVDERTTLVNGLSILEWSSDKTYLRDVADSGIPVVETSWCRPGEEWGPPAGQEFVIKPTVASGGLGAARYRSGRRAEADDHVRRLHDEGQTVMIQPYRLSVDDSGEAALVFFAGGFSHAINKGALLTLGGGETDRLWERETFVPIHPTGAQLEVGQAVVEMVAARFGPAVYARIDVVANEDGDPEVLEVEMVEPTLFLATSEGSADRLATALVAAGDKTG